MKINLKEKVQKIRLLREADQVTEQLEPEISVPEDVMIECDSLVKIYKTKDIEVLALQGLDLTVKRGELMAIIGNSGSGKSMFLNMIGGLDRPSAGKLYVDGRNLFQMTEEELLGSGIKPNTIRLSIGTEHIDDIIEDLEEAFQAV